ncbi:hypothetical protein U5N25_03485 [Exiguobacterium indicum]|uniref:hypothetical protein n=1 Tax=Exiguobacterium indicum TaxID=296995 RepID=UPI00397A16B0
MIKEEQTKYEVFKEKFKKNLLNFILIVLSILLILSAWKFKFIPKVPDKDDIHLAILTISTVFAGFMFTSLGLLIGFIDKANMPELESAGYTGQYFNGILIGIAFLVLSITVSFITVINPDFIKNCAIYNIEIFSLISGILFFLKAVIDVFSILRRVRNFVKDEYIKKLNGGIK